MKFVRVLKANLKLEKISETDWVIKSPDGIYKNSNGKDYHFKTKEDALEELDYLRAEHKFDKKSSSKRYTVEREDWGKSDIYEGKRDRMFYIYDNIENEPVCDDMGETIYYDNLEEVKLECEELNYSEAEHKNDEEAKQEKSDYSAYNEEDKAIYNETMELLKECRDLLNWHYEQGKDMNFDDYELDDTQRLYRQADLEVLRNIKTKIETLFEN